MTLQLTDDDEDETLAILQLCRRCITKRWLFRINTVRQTAAFGVFIKHFILFCLFVDETVQLKGTLHHLLRNPNVLVAVIKDI